MWRLRIILSTCKIRYVTLIHICNCYVCVQYNTSVTYSLLWHMRSHTAFLLLMLFLFFCFFGVFFCVFFVFFFIMTRLIYKHIITKTRLFKYKENFTSKKRNFSGKKTLIFFIFLLKNIDCGYLLEPPRRGGSNEYPQSMFLSRNKKNNVYPCKPQFYYIKVGFKGVKII